jgi:phage-related protein
MACSSCAHGANRALAGQFYCFLLGRRVMVLHAFIKKSQQTPERELKLARKRMKVIQNG